MYCYLCEDYIGAFATQRYCEECRVIKNIMNVYGRGEVRVILEDICLRDKEKRTNKINNSIENNCYSPSCVKTRSKTKEVKTN